MDLEKAKLALKKHKGNVSSAARSLKVDRSTLHRQIVANPDLKECMENSRESMLDDAENALGDAIKAGLPWAVCFALKTIGKDRGYTEKNETQHSGEMKIIIEYGDEIAPYGGDS